MGVNVEEQEVVINAMRSQSMASIYVTDRTWITKMEKLLQRSPELFKVKEVHKVNGEVIGKTYEFPKRLISIRASICKRELTEEQRKAAGERMREWRERKNTGILSDTDDEFLEDDFLEDEELDLMSDLSMPIE